MNAATELTNSPKARKGLSRRQLWILGGMSLLILALYLALGSLLLTSRPAPDAAAPVAQPSQIALALQNAQRDAQQLALEWQPDAQIVGATTSWQLNTGERLTLGRAAWSFSFYSPAQKKIQVVVADLSGATYSRQSRVSKAPQSVQADWTMGADDLLLTFMANGGKEFITFHSHANIHAQLQANEAGQTLWMVSAVDPVAQESFTVHIDALSRQVTQQD